MKSIDEYLDLLFRGHSPLKEDLLAVGLKLTAGVREKLGDFASYISVRTSISPSVQITRVGPFRKKFGVLLTVNYGEESDKPRLDLVINEFVDEYFKRHDLDCQVTTTYIPSTVR